MQTRNKMLAAIVVGIDCTGRKEARVLLAIDGTVDRTVHTYSGKGCETRAGNYLKGLPFECELVDHAVMVALQSEVFHAAVR